MRTKRNPEAKVPVMLRSPESFPERAKGDRPTKRRRKRAFALSSPTIALWYVKVWSR